MESSNQTFIEIISWTKFNWESRDYLHSFSDHTVRGVTFMFTIYQLEWSSLSSVTISLLIFVWTHHLIVHILLLKLLIYMFKVNPFFIHEFQALKPHVPLIKFRKGGKPHAGMSYFHTWNIILLCLPLAMFSISFESRFRFSFFQRIPNVSINRSFSWNQSFPHLICIFSPIFICYSYVSGQINSDFSFS